MVIEDEANLLSVIKAYLEKEEYQVMTAENGEQGLKLFMNQGADLILLDLMLPDLSGEEICSRVRQTGNVPILMLTAKTTERDRIHGLNLGADDYLTKPFSPGELIARIKAILRRSTSEGIKAEVIRLSGHELALDKSRMQVHLNRQHIDITATEFRILWLLASHPNQVFSREVLLNQIMGDEYEGYDRTIDVHIKNIRYKLGDAEHQLIETVYGAGYRLGEGSS